MARHFKVSRTVLREAVKILQGKGMVEVRPKTGIHIRPRSEWSLLDADLISWQSAVGLDEQFVRNLTRLRLILEPAAAQSAAIDGTDEEIQAIYNWQLKKEADPDDIEGCVDADLGFHRAIAQATHNDLLIHVTQNVLNAIRASIVYKNRRVSETFAFQLHREVAEAIRRRRTRQWSGWSSRRSRICMRA
jgi:DNA-binding FadR family transcriptional regulator